jgi:hypothetical protein
MVSWLAFLLNIQKILGSSVSPVAHCPDRFFFVVSSVPLIKCWISTVKYDCFLA